MERERGKTTVTRVYPRRKKQETVALIVDSSEEDSVTSAGHMEDKEGKDMTTCPPSNNH